MLVRLNGSVYTMDFHHVRFDEPQCDTLGPPIKAQTFCFIGIHKPPCSSVASGVAECSVNDQFNKEEGRKWSLKRALQAGAFNKSERTTFWKTYHNRNRKAKSSSV